ncbi:MAG: TPM domain-containing protein [Chthoniobacterales bacterium]
MRTKEFMARLDHARIVAAIAAAEAKSSGEIRVFIQRGEMADNPLRVAENKFMKLGMEKTAERNAILILVVPRARKFAVVGDKGVHERCGAEFWEQLVATMRGHFQREAFTEALLAAIESAGDLLARHFPPQSDDRNELLDDIVEG